MKEEDKKKLEELQETLRTLNQAVNKCQCSIAKIITDEGADFEGSYVVYFDGDDYIFMKVELQNIRGDGHIINLQGPALRLSGNPLERDEDDDDIDYSSYDESDGFSFTSSTLTEESCDTIKKITKEEMEKVLDYYANLLKEKLL